MFQFLSDYARSDQGQGHVFMPCFTGRRASSRSYVVFWVSPKWSHSFPGRHRSPLGLAPFVIDTPSVDVMGHARQASSTYARFDRLDIASGGGSVLLTFIRGVPLRSVTPLHAPSRGPLMSLYINFSSRFLLIHRSGFPVYQVLCSADASISAK